MLQNHEKVWLTNTWIASSFLNWFSSKGIDVSLPILMKQLTIQGFIVLRWLDQWPAAFKEMAQWIQEVKQEIN